MTTSIASHIAPGIAWGLLLGLLFFGGLWLTVRAVPRATRPGTLLLASFVLRAVIAVAGMWLALDRHPLRFAAALPSFFLVRFAMTRLLRPAAREARHAD